MAEGCREGIVVLASRTTESYLLINVLAARFEVAHVVFDRLHAGKMLRWRLRRLGVWKVAGQVLFLMWDRLVIRPRARRGIERLLAGRDARPPDGRLPVSDVPSVNGPEVTRLLHALRPCVVVVSGAGIIGREALALAPAFINIHTGITPRYRGVHGAFWAVFEGRPDLAGVTVHLVDAGVDTGAIIAQATIEIDPATDSFRTLPVRQYLAGLEPMIRAVEMGLKGSLAPYQRDDLESRQWYSPTPGEYARFLRRLRAMRR